MVPICKNEDPGNYRPASLTSVLVKVMEKIILSVISWHMQSNEGIGPSQHEFMKGRSCLIKLISFYVKTTCVVERKGYGCRLPVP